VRCTGCTPSQWAWVQVAISGGHICWASSTVASCWLVARDGPMSQTRPSVCCFDDQKCPKLPSAPTDFSTREIQQHSHCLHSVLIC